VKAHKKDNYAAESFYFYLVGLQGLWDVEYLKHSNSLYLQLCFPWFQLPVINHSPEADDPPSEIL